MLKLASVSFSYQKDGQPDLAAVRDVTLSFSTSEVAAIVGPSGCGKTTLLNIIAGIYNPASGSIEYSGLSGTSQIGYVFQEPSLIPWRTIWRNVLFAPELLGRIDSDTYERARVLLKKYGLAGFEQAYPSALSGGMQQRVALARAILAGAKILLLDEPFSDSDYSMRRGLQEDLSCSVSEEELTAIFVTHDLEEAVTIADRVIVLTHRPATVKEEIPIPIPRSERFEKKWGIYPELVPYLERVWGALNEGSDEPST